MTIQEAIDRADEMKQNLMQRDTKVKVLSEVDGLIWREVILKHEMPEDMATYTPYDGDTDPGQELLMPWPYDKAYVYRLMAEVDDMNLEQDKFNNDYSKFQSVFMSFCDWWRREHMPLTRVRELRV